MPKKRRQAEEEDGIADENVENYSGDMEDQEDEVEREYDSEEEERRRRKKRKKKKRKDEFKIMSKSDQTEADRRVLRRKQRELNADIALGAGGKTGDEELRNRRDANNELWDDVHYTREAVLDSENVDLLAAQAARQAEKLVQVPRYDAGKLAQALRKKGTPAGSSQFNWVSLGYQVGVCFNALPSNVSFLYGPLDAEYAPKERKKPERRKKQAEVESDEEEEAPEDVDQTGKKKSDGNELSAVEKHIKVINKTLMKRAVAENEVAQEKAVEYETQLTQEGIDDQRVLLKKKKKFIAANSQVDAVGCLFNPQSFTQTVENVFHFSFLVKQGHAGIKVRTNEEAEALGAEPGPVIRPTATGDNQPPPKQAIVSLNMKDWRDMCAAYNVERSDVPHRVDGKVAAKKEKKERKRKSNDR
ncbi:hypothetical protein ACHAXT_009598 [Thalassiosira profunda]